MRHSFTLYLCVLRQSGNIAQAGSKFMILLPQPKEYWDYSSAAPCLVYIMFFRKYKHNPIEESPPLHTPCGLVFSAVHFEGLWHTLASLQFSQPVSGIIHWPSCSLLTTGLNFEPIKLCDGESMVVVYIWTILSPSSSIL